MPVVTDLENRHQFAYPRIYHQLLADNMLDWGKFGAHWLPKEYPKLKERPPLLLYASDFELFDQEGCENRVNEMLETHERFDIDPKFRFVPFAASGAGDCYCFHLNERTGEDVPIVYFLHDADRVNYLAKNLQDFIFLKMLEVSVAAVDDGCAFRKELCEGGLQKYLASHAKYLTTPQRNVLQEIYRRDFIHPGEDDGSLGLLGAQEFRALKDQFAAYEKNGQSFCYELRREPPPQTPANKRYVGTLFLRVAPPIDAADKRQALFKALNWRPLKEDDSMTFYRKNSVFFGPPTIANVDEPFCEKLNQIASAFDKVEITFTDNETRATFLLR